MRFLEQWHVPRMLAALLLILAVFGTIVGLGAAIAGPASTWAAKLPEGIPRLQERLSFSQAPINSSNGFCSRWRVMDSRQEHPPLFRRGPANDAKGSERISNGQEHDLPMVRQGRRGCCPLLRRDLFPTARWVPSTVHPVTTRPARRATC